MGNNRATHHWWVARCFFSLFRRSNVRAKANVIMAVAISLIMVISLSACTTPKVQLPVLREAPGFALTNQDDLEVKLSDFRGKIVVVNFIYTTCPDVCGFMNHKLKSIQGQLDEGLKQDLVLISVSFDPAVDTPEVLKQYAAEQGFDVPGWHFLTGTPEQIRQVTDDYGAVYELEVVEADHEHEGSQEHGHIRGFNHNIVIVLIDRDGMVRKTYGYTFLTETEVISDITSLLS